MCDHTSHHIRFQNHLNFYSIHQYRQSLTEYYFPHTQRIFTYESSLSRHTLDYRYSNGLKHLPNLSGRVFTMFFLVNKRAWPYNSQKRKIDIFSKHFIVRCIITKGIIRNTILEILPYRQIMPITIIHTLSEILFCLGIYGATNC